MPERQAKCAVQKLNKTPNFTNINILHLSQSKKDGWRVKKDLSEYFGGSFRATQLRPQHNPGNEEANMADV